MKKRTAKAEMPISPPEVFCPLCLQSAVGGVLFQEGPNRRRCGNCLAARVTELKCELDVHDVSEDIMGRAINDGRRDVALILVEILRGPHPIGNGPLVDRIVDDPYIGIEELLKQTPVPMILFCPSCNKRHIDGGAFALRPHKTHACQKCGFNWKPARVPTMGVQFLPGCKNKEKNNA